MSTLLEMREITKEFPGVRALDRVSVAVKQGEIHAICGENGAGKSTLMKVLSGVYPAGSYEGEIVYEGQPVAFRDIRDSEARGIIIIHQELALVPQLSVAENIFLGNERATRGVIDWHETNKRTEALLAKVGLREPPTVKVDSLGVGKQQLVEIAKALSKDVKLLILDEPTAALQENDSRKLLDLMLELKAQGVTCIIISHKLGEVRYVADTVTVIRDGTTVSTLDARQDLSEDRIVRDMVGRDMTHRFPEHARVPGDILLEVEGWSVWHPEHAERRVIKDACFTVPRRRGRRNRRSHGFRAAPSWPCPSSDAATGAIFPETSALRGKPVDVSTVDRAIAAGLSYVTEDRKALGLVLDETVRFNTTLANLPAVSSGGILNRNEETRVAEKYRDARSRSARRPCFRRWSTFRAATSRRWCSPNG